MGANLPLFFAPRSYRAFALCPVELWSLYSLPRRVVEQCNICPANQRRLRCIRPPQSQCAPNLFLKTSMCADGSQQVHKRIGSISLILYFCGFLEFFISENLVFGFSSKKRSWYADIEMPYCTKSPLLTRPTKFW